MSRKSGHLELRLGPTQPLILYGMHRSGTSLMVRLLVDMGFHMGSWLSRDAESVHFQKLNRRIFSAAGSTWGEVDALLHSMGSGEFIARQTELTRRRLFRGTPLPGGKPAIEGFFAPISPWDSRLEPQGGLPWGFKDPRTTLTLPIWLRIFPHARYVHVLRNGIDVAISIHRRSLKQQRKLRNRFLRFDYVPATLDFDYSFHLWEQYVSFALECRPAIPAGQYLELCYEDLLARPEEQLGRLLEFLEYRAAPGLVSAACERIDQSRRDNTSFSAAYRDKIPQLASSPLMQQLGYAYPLEPAAGPAAAEKGSAGRGDAAPAAA